LPDYGRRFIVATNNAYIGFNTLLDEDFVEHFVEDEE